MKSLRTRRGGTPHPLRILKKEGVTPVMLLRFSPLFTVDGETLVAPTVTAADSLSGRTLTVTVSESTGSPAPTFSIAMTADEEPVTPTLVSPGVWTYTVPSSFDAVDLAWMVTAANGVSPNATASGAETVPANQTVSITNFVAEPISNGLSFSFDHNLPDGAYRVVAQVAGEVSPTGEQRLAGQDSTGSAAAGATALVTISEAGTVTNSITGLTPGVSYDLFAAVETPGGVIALGRRDARVAGYVAPTVTMAFAEASYVAGATVDASDLEPTIAVAGSPVLELGDLTLALIVDGSPVSLPYTAVEGASMVARATWTHPATSGTQTANSDALVVVPLAVNPTLTSVGLTSPGSGARQQLALSYSYPNDPAPDTLVLYAVTSSEETMPGADAAAQRANIIAGIGTGSVEEFSVDPLGTTTVDLIGSGLTAASESATWLHAFIAEKNNGGVSAIVSTNIAALDLTPPAFSSAVPADNATDAAIDVSPAITFAENVFAGEGVFTLRNVTAGTDVETFDIETGTGSAGGTIGISGAVVTINPNADLANSTDYSIRWPAGALLDANGNPVAVNAGDTIYNFTTVAVASSGITFLAERDVFSVDLLGITSETSSAIAPTAGANRGAFLVLTSEINTSGSAPVISAEWGAGNAFDIVGEMIPAVGSQNMIIVVFMMREADLPAGAEAITVNSTQGIRRLVGNLIEYENVHQATSPGVLNTATGSAGAAITLTGTMTSADGLFFGVSAWRNSLATPVTVTAGAGSTTPVKRVDRSGAADNTVAVADELPGATGSVSHDHTASASGNRARVVLEIFPAA